MTTEDPFAPWRNASEFTIDEAADLIAGIVPGRTFPHPKDQTDRDRELIAQRNKWRSLLREHADALGIAKRSAPAQAPVRGIRGPGFARDW